MKYIYAVFTFALIFLLLAIGFLHKSSYMEITGQRLLLLTFSACCFYLFFEASKLIFLYIREKLDKQNSD